MPQIYYTAFRAMGCAISVQLETRGDGEALLSALPAEIDALENILSRFRPHSELIALNRQTGQWTVVSETLYDNVRLAKHAAWQTDGLFNPLVLPALRAAGYDRSFHQIDPTFTAESPVPAADWQQIDFRRADHAVFLPEGGEIDLGGIAKGWAAQHLAGKLAAHGAVLVNLGGDIVTRGAPSTLPGWQIDIIDPCGTTPLIGVLLRDGAIVTSGTDYRRWHSAGRDFHHIIDPRTGSPAQTDVLSVTVIAPDAILAEAYAKAVLLKGSAEGLNWLNAHAERGAAGLVVRQNGEVIATDGFLDYVEFTPNMAVVG